MPDVAAVADVSEPADRQAELVRQVIAGDRRALAVWFEQFQGSVYSFVYYRVGGDAEMAADATQATFLIALEKLGNFDPNRGGMANWLRYLSRNIVRDLLAQRRRGVQLQARWDEMDDASRDTLRKLDTQLLPDRVIEREETRHLVGVALANLPETYREVLEARYFEGLSLQVIAETRGTTVDGVKAMIRRARQAFRDGFLEVASLETHDV